MTSRPRALTCAGAVLAAALVASLAAAPAQAAVPQIQMAALGDSATNAAAVSGALGSPVGDTTASWSTGTNPLVDSHLQHLQDAGAQVTASRYSVNGKTSSDVQRQAGLVNSSTDYTTIMIGGNDVCLAGSLSSAASKSTYKARVLGAVDVLIQKNPDMVIALNSVPSIKTLYAVGTTSSNGRAAYGSNQVCRIGLGTYTGETAAQAQARRDSVDVRIREYNAALSEIAQARPQAHYDGGAVYSTPFVLSNISTADYFHPSVSGQDLLAERSWNAFEAQGVYDELLDGGTTTPPPATAVAPTVSPSSITVSGSARAAFTVTSDTAISSAVLVIPAYGTVPLSRSGSSSTWQSAVIDTRGLPNGSYAGTVTAKDAQGDTTVKPVTVTVRN